MKGLARLAASQKALRFSCTLLAAITLAPPLAFGGINRWTSGGQLGGFIDSLAIDPMNPETVYAGTGRAVLKSTDGGLTWTSSFAVFSGDNSFIGSLAIDPSSSASIYAATTGGLFKSVDAGGTWKEIFDARVYSLAVDPFSPSTIFAGTAGGLAKSTDGGATWSGRLLAASIYNLVFSREGPSTIIGADFDPSYYPDTGSHLYRSTDGGANWIQSDCIPNIPPGALAVDPTSSSTLYTGSLRAASGLFKTVDSGLTWSLVNDGAYATAVVIDPQNPGTIYAAAQGGGGFIRSIDGGASWQDFNTGLNRPPLWITALAIDQTATRLYAGTDYGEVFSYRISSDALELSGALDLSVGTDNKTRTLFVDSDHLAVVRSFDNSGKSSGSGPYGPYSRWSARAVADGSDGLTRVLWNNLDGSAALWLLGPTGNQASYLYGPTAGWTAVDVSVGRDGTTHLLWTNNDGRTKLTTVAVSGAVVGETTYGPYNGWIARSISDGADGLTRILWSNNDGRVGLSLIDAGHIVATYRFAPGRGWGARDVAVAADNKTRILFVNVDGRMAIWSVDNSGAVTDSGTVYAPPSSGRAAIRISAGADGLTRVLWTSPEGTGTLWLMGLDNVLQNSFDFCGGFDSSGCSPWDY